MNWKIGFPDEWAPRVKEYIAAAVPEDFELEFFDPVADENPDALIARSDYLVVGKLRITKELLARAPKLRMVQRWGVGYDNVDLDAARAAGVTVAITAGANAEMVAEHTLMLMLATLRRLTAADDSVREGRWLEVQAGMRARARQLLDRTVGIVGFGNIGQAVAKRVVGFDAKIIYSDIRRASEDVEAKFGAEYVPLDELLKRADIITIHSGGGDATRHLIDAAAIGSMKPDAVVINAARGSIIDETALADALREGRLMGAGLDVFEQEPLDPSSPLTELDNTVLTPHTAGSVLDNVTRVAAQSFRNIRNHIDGKPIAEQDLIV